jgi:hypothetical protein
LIITNPTIARQMMAVFEEDWEAAATKKDEREEEPAEAKAPAKSADTKAEARVSA